MKKIYYILIIFFFISNCTLNKTINTMVLSLRLKSAKLYVNNQIKMILIKLLGQPSTKSNFDEDLWIYIERKTAQRIMFREKRVTNSKILS